MMTGEDALSILVEAKLSRHQYYIIRSSAPEKFPSYKIVQDAKKALFPPSMHVSEKFAAVPLQALLDHTVKRLMSLESVIDSLSDEDLHQLILISKWEFDGPSGHSSYKQAFHNEDADDSAIFITSVVPLHLVCDENTVWQNSRPASRRYCRPVNIQFVKESKEVCIKVASVARRCFRFPVGEVECVVRS